MYRAHGDVGSIKAAFENRLFNKIPEHNTRTCACAHAMSYRDCSFDRALIFIRSNKNTTIFRAFEGLLSFFFSFSRQLYRN